MKNLISLTLVSFLTGCGAAATSPVDTSTLTATSTKLEKAEVVTAPDVQTESVPQKSAKRQAILADVTDTETDTATDTTTATSTDIITVNDRIAVTVNHKPSLSGDGDVTINEGDFVTIHLIGSDQENDTITYTCVQNCPSQSLGQANDSALDANGVFTWQSDFNSDGTYQMVFRANDGLLDSDDYVVNLTVNDSNRAPFINAMVSQTISENQTLSLDVFAEDLDLNNISIALISPAGVAHTSLTQAAEIQIMAGGINHTGRHGAFTFTPDNTQAGQYNFIFRVTDNYGLLSERAVVITVNNAVDAPAMAPIGNKTVTATNNLAFAVSTSGGNGSAITVSATGLPTGATLVSGNFSWTPACTVSGDFDIIFTATDGSLSQSETIKVSVAAKSCGAPVWTQAPSFVSTNAPGDTARTISIGHSVNPNPGIPTYGFVAEWDCNNRDWTQSFNTTTKVLTFTNAFTHPFDEGAHYFLFYSQNQFGERSYRRVRIMGSYYTTYQVVATDGVTSSANLCGAGNSVFQH